MKLLKSQFETMKEKGLISEEVDTSQFEIVEDDAILTDAQQKKVDELVGSARTKARAKADEEHNAKIEEIQASASTSAEEKIALIEKANSERIANIENTLKQTEVENARVNFKNRMLSAGIDETLAETISKTTSVDAMAEYNIDVLPKKVTKNMVDPTDEKGQKVNSIIELAKKM